MGLTVHCESILLVVTFRYILMFTPIITLTQYEYGAVQIGSGRWYVLPVDAANLHKSYIHTVVTFLGVNAKM